MNLLHLEIPNRFIILDVETSGLEDGFSEIIELAAILVETKGLEYLKDFKYFDEMLEHVQSSTQKLSIKEVNHFHAIVDANTSIEEEITKLNGFTDEIVWEYGEPQEVVVQNLEKFIFDLPVIVYNRNFTSKYLDNLYEYADKEFTNKLFCIQTQLKNTLFGLNSYKLNDVIEHFKISEPHEYRALKDARLILKIINSVL